MAEGLPRLGLPVRWPPKTLQNLADEDVIAALIKLKGFGHGARKFIVFSA